VRDKTAATCPKCFSRYRVPAGANARKIRCPKDGAFIILKPRAEGRRNVMPLALGAIVVAVIGVVALLMTR